MKADRMANLNCDAGFFSPARALVTLVFRSPVRVASLLTVSIAVHLPVHATDMAATHKLHEEKCVACHVQKSAFGDPDAIYRRSDSTVKSLQRLRTMVSLCNSELRLDLFPEDEQDLVAYLNQRYYKLAK